MHLGVDLCDDRHFEGAIQVSLHFGHVASREFELVGLAFVSRQFLAARAGQGMTDQFS